MKASLLLLFTPLDPPPEPRGSSAPRDALSWGAEPKSSSASSRLRWHSPYVLDFIKVFLGGGLSRSSRSAGTVSTSPSSSSQEKSESCPSLWQSGGCARLRLLRKSACNLRGLNGRTLCCLGKVTLLQAVLVTFASLTHAGATFFPLLVPLPMPARQATPPQSKCNVPFSKDPSGRARVSSWMLIDTDLIHGSV